MKSVQLFFKSLTIWKKLALLISPVLAILISMQTALIGLVFLIFVDLITGINKTQNEKGIPTNPFKKAFWTSIKSYLLRKTWRKSYEYGIGIIVVVVFEALVFGSASIHLISKTFTISEIAVIVPAIIELWSIFENLEQKSGNNVLKRLITVFPRNVQRLFTGDKGRGGRHHGGHHGGHYGGYENRTNDYEDDTDI